MKRNVLRISVLASVLIAISGISLTSFAQIPITRLVKTCPVIVVGKVVKVKIAPPPPKNNPFSTYDTAYVKVSKILKNTTSDRKIKVGDKIPVSMISKNRPRYPKGEIYYKKGQNGVWLLKTKAGRLDIGTYWASFLGQFQPLKKEKEIRDLISKEK